MVAPVHDDQARAAGGDAGVLATPPWGGAVAGLIAGAAGLGASEVLARLVPRPSLVLAVGEVVISAVPPSVEDAAIATFGRSDKAVLVAAITIVSLALAAALGAAARSRPWVPVGGFLLSAAAGAAAGISRSPAAPVATVLVAGGGAAGGLVVLWWLVHPARPAVAAPGRRRVLRFGASAVAATVLAGAAGRRLARTTRTVTDPDAVDLAPVTSPLPAAAPATSVGVDGVSPLFTPNRSFYRIDTALIVPRVDIDAWRLGITGLVDRPVSLGYRDLARLPQVEADITVSCVSNDVGGDLVGNARWQGVLLADLLRQAGVRPEATQVVGRALDGWTAGFPTALALDGRTALVALGMNGRPLPLAHGFPARLVVPGLYGYVSATKWLRQIELTTLEAFDGYWVPRGWAKEGPVKTTTRIDVPGAGAAVRAGPVAVGGVAWAPHRGIAGVEVSVDGGPWTEATMAQALGVDAWRQWRFDWDATPGTHELRARSTDGTGQVQTGARSPVKPDGATGYHAVRVKVT